MQQPTQTGAGMTLQQVIKLVDTRLLTLEKFMSENTNEDGEDGVPSEWMEEFNKRTEIIAVEIDSIKTTVLQLQAFTMEVNKKMFEKIEALTAKQPVSFAREVPSTVAQVVPAAPAPVPAPVPVPVVAPEPTPAITLELTAAPATPAPVETPLATNESTVSIEPSNTPIISRFENKSKKNNNSPAST
jgi:hypothetical protein